MNGSTSVPRASACTPAVRLGIPLLAAALLVACGSPEPVVTVRLVDRFADATVHDSPVEVPIPEPVEWRWDGEARVEPPEDAGPTRGWTAPLGVEELEVVDGRLRGRTTDAASLVDVPIPEELDLGDRLHAVEIRMRVSEGDVLGVGLGDEAELDEEALEGIAESLRESRNRPLTAELRPGDEMATYRLTLADSSFAPSFSLADARRLGVMPTDVAGAEFEIESVRVVSRKQHLASIPSGPGWQGLDDVYRETVVARAPERVLYDLELPERPWLDLAVGTIEARPVTFKVGIVEGDSTTTVLERTVTRPERWEPLRVDLADRAGQGVRLALEFDASDPGTLGYWGTLVIRNGGARPSPGPASPGREALSGDRPEPPRGVVLILADTLRRDHLTSWGYDRETAPNLARLAREGAFFEDAIAQGSWTKVSVPSILASLYPSTHGIVDTPDRLPASVTTLTEAYREAGYATFHTSSVPFTGKLTNLHQGVEVMHERASLEVDHSGSKTARTFVDRLEPWLRDHRDVPFFVLLHVFDPHSPFKPYEPYDAMWAEAGAEKSHEEMFEKLDELDADTGGPGGLPRRDELVEAGVDPDAFVRIEKDWYDGSIRAMDAEIGRLMERLRELGLDEDTLIAFVSDHGEEFLEHGRHFHGYTTYGEMLNVPLVLWWPGRVPAGAVVDRTVQTIDLLPTLLELSRLPVPERAQGQSLLPLLAAPERPGSLGWSPTPAFAERRLPPSERDPEPDDVDSYAMVADGWKLVHNTRRPDGWPEYELYDHEADPLNLEDVASRHPEVVERMAAELAAWRERAEAARVVAEDPGELDPEELDRLRALGYVQ